MWFRVLLGALAVILLAVCVWMGTHISANPVVFGRWARGYAAILGVLLIGCAAAALLAGPFYRHVHGWRHNAATVFIATALSLAIVELLVRWSDPLGISYYEEAGHYHRAKLPDTDLYYVHESGLASSYRGFDVRINSLGMRGRDVGPKETGEVRVLFLGDSVTFGWGVPEQDIFAEVVETLLIEKLGRPVRTLNSGVGSFNTENQSAFLDRYGEQLAPDVVALIYVSNDIEQTPQEPFDPLASDRVTQMSPPQVFRWLLGRSWTYRLAVHAIRLDSSTAETQGLDLESAGWRESSLALARIAEWCDSRDMPLVTYLYRIEPDPLTDALLVGLNDVSAQHGFRVVDTLPWFEGHDPRTLINSIVDTHPNAAAHAILAESIAVSIADVLRGP